MMESLMPRMHCPDCDQTYRATKEHELRTCRLCGGRDVVETQAVNVTSTVSVSPNP
jgi:Zn finger protein HypA/HybF involved in hydrogenase expression